MKGTNYLGDDVLMNLFSINGRSINGPLSSKILIDSLQFRPSGVDIEKKSNFKVEKKNQPLTL